MKVLGIENPIVQDRLQKQRERLVASWGTNALIGTPEQVTAQLAQVSAAGIEYAKSWISGPVRRGL